MPGNPNFATIDATTLDYFSSMVTDVITGQEALLQMIEDMGSKRVLEGGKQIEEELMFTKNTTFRAQLADSPVNMGPTDPLTCATFTIKTYAGSMQQTLLEQLQNRGNKTVITNAQQQRIENLIISARLALDTDLFSDGSDPLKIGGLQLLVEDGTSYQTVGNIDSSVYSVWQNQWIGSIGNGYTNLLKIMRRGRIRARRGNHKISLWVTDADGRECYESFCTQILRMNMVPNKRAADLGIDNVDYSGAALINEPGVPAGFIWGLDLSTIHWNVFKGAEFELTPFVQPYNQLVSSRLCYLFGQLSINHRAANFLGTGATYT